MIFARLILVLTSLMHLGFGAAYLARPVAMGKLTHFGLSAPVAATEIRAFYGGLEIGLAAFLAVCAVKSGWAPAGLAAIVLIYAGLVLGRTIGLIVDQSASRLMFTVIAVEILTGVLAAVAWGLLRGRGAS